MGDDLDGARHQWNATKATALMACDADCHCFFSRKALSKKKIWMRSGRYNVDDTRRCWLGGIDFFMMSPLVVNSLKLKLYG